MTKVHDAQLKTLAASLRRYRLEQNFTYRELAKLIGLGHSRLFTFLNNAHPNINERTRYRLELFAQRVGLMTERRSA